MLNLSIFRNVIGLDISDFKIRFIQLKLKGKENKTKINSFGEILVPKKLIQNGNISDEKKVIELITKLLDKPQYGSVDTKYVNASLPEKQTYLKTFEIPDVPANEIKGAVAWGIEQNIPVSLDGIHYDWQVIGHTNGKNGVKKLNILSVVAPKKTVNIYTKIIKESGLMPISLENESIPIARCLINTSKQKFNSVLIIDIGRSRSNLIIFSNNRVQYTSSIDISGHEMTKAISEIMKLDLKDAEKAKIIYGLSSRKARGIIRKILEPVLKRLISRVEESIEYHNSFLKSKNRIDTIILTGSVSQMSGITDYLKDGLHANVITGNPLINLPPLNKMNKKDHIELYWKNNSYSFTTAIGLALKKYS